MRKAEAEKYSWTSVMTAFGLILLEAHSMSNKTDKVYSLRCKDLSMSKRKLCRAVSPLFNFLYTYWVAENFGLTFVLIQMYNMRPGSNYFERILIFILRHNPTRCNCQKVFSNIWKQISTSLRLEQYFSTIYIYSIRTLQKCLILQ